MLPQFGWAVDALAAEQAWSGFLTWGKLNSQALVDDMLPRYEETFGHVEALGEQLQQHFLTHLAVIAIDHVTSPFEHGWLGRFTSAASPEERKGFISSLGYVFRNRTPQICHDVFERWLRAYWRNRNEGLPTAWCDEELRELPDVVIQLGDDFVEGVELLTQSQPVDFGPHHTSIYQLAQSGLSDSYPNAVAKMLVWMLEATQQPFWGISSANEVFERLSTVGADASLLRQIQEHLTRLG